MNERELDKRTLHTLLRLQMCPWQGPPMTPLPPKVHRMLSKADVATLEALLVEVTRRLEVEHFHRPR